MKIRFSKKLQLPVVADDLGEVQAEELQQGFCHRTDLFLDEDWRRPRGA